MVFDTASNSSHSADNRHSIVANYTLRMVDGPMIRVFVRRTSYTPDDDLAYIGDPPMFLPPQMPVRISVVFTWDIAEGKRLLASWSQYYDDVELGGPAFGLDGVEFVPGRFIRHGITFTSRGCNNKCKFCFVPEREGRIVELEIKDGYIIQDNNLLQCSRQHIEGVFAMLGRQKRPAIFKGGLQASLLRQWHRPLFDGIRMGELWFACDSQKDLKALCHAGQILYGIHRNKLRCYVLLGFDKSESIEDAEKRLKAVWNLGFLPHAPLYQPEKRIQYSKEWRELSRNWSRPAITRSIMTGDKSTESIWREDGMLL